MTDKLKAKRRYLIHVPQLVGRVSYPQHGQELVDSMRRLVSEYDTAMSELQSFLKYLQNSSDESVVAGAFYAEDPEMVDAGAPDPGDPTVGWSPGDHKHQADIGPPAGLGNANATGAGPQLAAADHIHKRDVRVKSEGADVATRNALDFRDSASIDVAVADDGGNDEVDVSLTAKPWLNTTAVSSTPYTVLATDFVLLVDASGGAITVNLPAANVTKRWLEVKKVDSSANKVIIDAAGADLIDGDATLELLFEDEAVPIVSDGTSAWSVL